MTAPQLGRRDDTEDHIWLRCEARERPPGRDREESNERLQLSLAPRKLHGELPTCPALHAILAAGRHVQDGSEAVSEDSLRDDRHPFRAREAASGTHSHTLS